MTHLRSLPSKGNLTQSGWKQLRMRVLRPPLWQGRTDGYRLMKREMFVWVQPKKCPRLWPATNKKNLHFFYLCVRKHTCLLVKSILKWSLFVLSLLILYSTVFFDYRMRHGYLVEVPSLRLTLMELKRSVRSWELLCVSALLAHGADEEVDEEAWK